jgi:hypothetical protein
VSNNNADSSINRAKRALKYNFPSKKKRFWQIKTAHNAINYFEQTLAICLKLFEVVIILYLAVNREQQGKTADF